MAIALDADLEAFLLELFQALRQAEMALTLEQFDLLRRAIAQGFGLGGWDDLERLCRSLFVKPSPNYDGAVFERTFQEFKRNHARALPERDRPSPPERATPPVNLPPLPPRNFQRTNTPSPEAIKAPIALQTSPPPALKRGSDRFQLTPSDLPVRLRDVQQSWQGLRRPVQAGQLMEIDLDRTLTQIEREGVFSDVVQRPVRVRKAELLLLVDSSPAMLPFRPVIQPFLEAIAHNYITPAQRYRFIAYPQEFLTTWENGTQREPLSLLLPRLHRYRTVALILSDGGAASGTYSESRVEGVTQFLMRLSPCVRQILWVNPLPAQRWEYTSAEAINKLLNGDMRSLTPESLRQVTPPSNLEVGLRL